jgi:hypothetical protein
MTHDIYGDPTFAHTTFVQRHLPRDICPERHLPRRHLPRRHLPRKTFAQMDICPEDVCPEDVCPERHLLRKTFAQKTFAQKDVYIVQMRKNVIFAFLWLNCTKLHADSCPILRTSCRRIPHTISYQVIRVLNLYSLSYTHYNRL